MRVRATSGRLGRRATSDRARGLPVTAAVGLVLVVSVVIGVVQTFFLDGFSQLNDEYSLETSNNEGLDFGYKDLGTESLWLIALVVVSLVVLSFTTSLIRGPGHKVEALVVLIVELVAATFIDPKWSPHGDMRVMMFAVPLTVALLLLAGAGLLWDRHQPTSSPGFEPADVPADRRDDEDVRGG